MTSGHTWLSAPATWWIVLWYCGLAAWAAWPRLRPATWISCLLVLLWLLVGAAEVAWRNTRLANGRLTVTFYAVGHGTAVLLEGPTGNAVLYDAGRQGPPGQIADFIASDLWNRGYRRLDAVIISHADADHFNALPNLVERFRPATAITARHFRESTAPLVVRMRRHLESHGTPPGSCAAGRRLRLLPGVTMDVLHPPASGVRGSDNANSVVLRIQYAGRRLLLPGDLEPPGVGLLLRQPAQKYDLVMAPHHGSVHSQPERLAAWARPSWVVVSNHQPAASGLRNVYRHWGSVVLDTASSGAIRIVIQADGRMDVHRWRLDPWPHN